MRLHDTTMGQLVALPAHHCIDELSSCSRQIQSHAFTNLLYLDVAQLLTLEWTDTHLDITPQCRGQRIVQLVAAPNLGSTSLQSSNSSCLHGSP